MGRWRTSPAAGVCSHTIVQASTTRFLPWVNCPPATPPAPSPPVAARAIDPGSCRPPDGHRRYDRHRRAWRPDSLPSLTRSPSASPMGFFVGDASTFPFANPPAVPEQWFASKLAPTGCNARISRIFVGPRGTPSPCSRTSVAPFETLPIRPQKRPPEGGLKVRRRRTL